MSKKIISLVAVLVVLLILVVAGLLFIGYQTHHQKGQSEQSSSYSSSESSSQSSSESSSHPSSESSSSGTASSSSEDGATSSSTYPLYFSVMIHLEEDWNDDTNSALFQRHEEVLQYAMQLFDEYGAKLTIESEEPFAKAVIAADSSLLNDALADGHGVGTHCGKDVDGNTIDELAAAYKERKDLVDSIVGAENNRGCSGGWGTTDYVLAATEAGFGYLDGVVYLAYLSMPVSKRPNHLSNQDIQHIYYHDPAIPDFSDHIYPRFLADAQDFVEDPEGELVLLNGELGEISSLYEGRQSCGISCVFTSADTQVILDNITTAAAIRDPSRVAHLYVHIPLNTFTTENEALLRAWLENMQQLQNQGTVVWATQKEVYEAKLSERE